MRFLGKTIGLAMLIACTTMACGQKGPLYLEERQPQVNRAAGAKAQKKPTASPRSAVETEGPDADGNP